MKIMTGDKHLYTHRPEHPVKLTVHKAQVWVEVGTAEPKCTYIDRCTMEFTPDEEENRVKVKGIDTRFYVSDGRAA